MSNSPTPNQALLLFGLLALHGECAQADLMPAVKKADREALERAKLIGVEKAGRGYYLRLLDAGWGWAGANLAAQLPPAHQALHEFLGRLGEHLTKNDQTLAKFIGGKPEKASAEVTRSKVAKPKATRPRPVQPKAPSPTALRKRVEIAYLSLTGGRRNESVRLAHLREALSDLDRATVDGALGRILKGDKKASLMRHDDPNQLAPADHRAAFSPAGEPFHVIWIAS